MVRPTTWRPSRTRSAATVELSTPPLMATATGASGMHGDPAQVRHGRFDRLDEGVHLVSGSEAAERKTNAGAGPFRREPDGGQDMRRRDRAARAGGAGGNGEAAEIERDDQGFAIDPVKVDVGGVGSAGRARAVDAGIGNAIE